MNMKIITNTGIVENNPLAKKKKQLSSKISSSLSKSSNESIKVSNQPAFITKESIFTESEPVLISYTLFQSERYTIAIVLIFNSSSLFGQDVQRAFNWLPPANILRGF